MSTVTNSLNKVFFRQSATPEHTIASQEAGVVYYGSIVDGGLLIDDSGDGTPIAGPFQTLTPYEDGQRVAFVLRGARPLILSIEGGFTATNQWSGLESITESTAEHSAEVEKALGEAKAALDEEMENLDERLETSRADITQAQEDAANLRTAIDLGLMRTGKASSPPAVGKGLTWAVLDEDTGTKVSGLRIANAAGTEWTPYQLIAEDLMIVGAGGTVRLKDGVVDADVILANDALYKKLATSEFWATLATVENLVVTSKMLGNEIEGKVFKGGLVRGAKVETDALTVGPQVQTETYMTLWESNFNVNTTGWAGILGTIARVTTPVYEGPGSLRITYAYPKKRVAAGGLVIPAQVGDVISAWVRTPSAGGYAYIAYDQQQGGGVLRYVGNSKPLPANTWVRLENSVSEPGIIEGLEVVFEDTVGSLVYVDLVQARRPQTSIGAAQFTISEGGAALLTAGGKSIVVEDLIDAALLGPNEIRIGGVVYARSGTFTTSSLTMTAAGNIFTANIQSYLDALPAAPAGWVRVPSIARGAGNSTWVTNASGQWFVAGSTTAARAVTVAWQLFKDG